MLLDDIINILSDEKGSLSAALIKTKVLLHSIGKKELATWVNNELKGYPDENNLPEYRICSSDLHASVANLRLVMKDYILPIQHLTEEQTKAITVSPCILSVASIEQAVRGYHADGDRLTRHMPPEYANVFARVLAPGANILSMWVEINMVDVENILTEVRSRLLDFLLELRDVVGIDVPEKELAGKVASVDTEKMFTTAVYGSGNTIIIGSHHIQAITNQKDDIEGLIQVIAKLGFQQTELDDLRKAVTDDKASGKTPDVADGETGKWYTKALKEAGKGVVKVGVDVVAATIVQAVKGYMG
jgi:AbiTii